MLATRLPTIAKGYVIRRTRPDGVGIPIYLHHTTPGGKSFWTRQDIRAWTFKTYEEACKAKDLAVAGDEKARTEQRLYNAKYRPRSQYTVMGKRVYNVVRVIYIVSKIDTVKELF
jgi:hypothetical protein